MPQSQGIRIGRILGIPIFLDISWILVFALFTWSLYGQFSSGQHSSWSSTERWGLALVTSFLFFASVVLHELAHSVVAQRYKIKVLAITLFLFGGLARIAREPSLPIQEFNIAIAGPISSGLLAGFFWALVILSPFEMLRDSAEILYYMNGTLALFNLLPGFPLDGGRVFRALVWGATKDFGRATRVAGASGKLIAYVMIALGILSFIAGRESGSSFEWVNRYSGPWLAFIGWFLLVAAQASVTQVTIRETLVGLTAP